MTSLTRGQLDTLTFLSGLDENGAVAANSFWSWKSGQSGTASVPKWNNDADGVPLAATSRAGTPGGTVTYAFGAEVGAPGRAAYDASLTLWSDIADIQFKQVSDPATANLLITGTRTANASAYTPTTGTAAGAGITDIPAIRAPDANGTQSTLNIFALFSNEFNSLAPGESWLLSTAIHEEGHILGLGHAGRYDGDGGRPEQFNMYDNKLWTMMSYITPDNTTAPYYSDYTVHANWTSPTPTGPSTDFPQSPMMLDIKAAQRLYGVSKSATFSGGQTYGFHSNIADASKQFYDFTVNTSPIVTIYNSGANNTLDLSGFASNSTVNLNPGTFSSASTSGALVNNIGIAYDTRIDKAVGGSGNDTFILNGNGDIIDGRGGHDTVIVQGDSANFTVTRTGATTTIVDARTGRTDTLTNVETIQFASPVCFTTGTRILTARGEVAVEDLRIGDRAVTATGRRRTVTWTGHRHLGAERPIPADQAPIRIRAGAFGQGRPTRDLLLSPGHPVLVGADADSQGGALVPVMYLINGTSIARTLAAHVTYWHVELDAHDILLAEGLPAESFLDCGCRPFFAVASDHASHNPDFVPSGPSGRCRPVAVDGPLVEAERDRLGAVFARTLADACAWGADAGLPPFDDSVWTFEHRRSRDDGGASARC